MSEWRIHHAIDTGPCHRLVIDEPCYMYGGGYGDCRPSVRRRGTIVHTIHVHDGAVRAVRACRGLCQDPPSGSPPPTVASIGPASSPGLGLQCLVPWWPWEKPWPTAGRGDRHAHGTATDGRGRSIGDHSLNPTALTAQVMILSSCMVPVTPMASMMRP